jgi:outer membrane protein OmpA-like peptidoglycan-associated protein
MKLLVVASLALAVIPLAPVIAAPAAPPPGPDFVSPVPARRVDRALAASDGTRPIEPTAFVMFGLDSAALDPIAIAQVETIATWMAHHPRQHLVLEGHTDRLGTSDHNEDLARDRALAVRDLLGQHGIATDRIVIAVFGERGAHAPADPGDRKVVAFASLRPVRQLVSEMLDATRAEIVAWTDRGARLEETRGLTASR